MIIESANDSTTTVGILLAKGIFVAGLALKPREVLAYQAALLGLAAEEDVDLLAKVVNRTAD